MSLCNLIEIKPNVWHCPDCSGPLLGGNYKRQCKASGNPSVRRRNVERVFTTRYNAIEKPVDLPTLNELLERLKRCQSADCKHLTGRICTRRGSSCKQMTHWFNYLMLHDSCDQWSDP